MMNLFVLEVVTFFYHVCLVTNKSASLFLIHSFWKRIRIAGPFVRILDPVLELQIILQRSFSAFSVSDNFESVVAQM
jgi:hypothetical protein